LPSAIGSLMREVLRRRGLSRRSFPAGLDAAWAEAVGPARARATRIGGFRNGVLTIEVESAPLRCELETFYREDLLDRMRVLAPQSGIRRIAFRVWGRR
jgi:predicted nucleic acid-binding Zn ribbon protein